MRQIIQQALKESVTVQQSLEGHIPEIIRSAEMIVKAFRAGNKLLIVGNGGAASDAQHIAAEFVATYKMERRGLPAICFNGNASTTTAWTNDFSFDTLYARQIEAFGKKGDILLALSSGGGSLVPGRSANIAFAAKRAKEMGIEVIGLTGKTGGALKDLSDPCIIIKSSVTARIQEAHLTICHSIIELIDETMFGKLR